MISIPSKINFEVPDSKNFLSANKNIEISPESENLYNQETDKLNSESTDMIKSKLNPTGQKISLGNKSETSEKKSIYEGIFIPKPAENKEILYENPFNIKILNPVIPRAKPEPINDFVSSESDSSSKELEGNGLSINENKEGLLSNSENFVEKSSLEIKKGFVLDTDPSFGNPQKYEKVEAKFEEKKNVEIKSQEKDFFKENPQNLVENDGRFTNSSRKNEKNIETTPIEAANKKVINPAGLNTKQSQRANKFPSLIEKASPRLSLTSKISESSEKVTKTFNESSKFIKSRSSSFSSNLSSESSQIIIEEKEPKNQSKPNHFSNIPKPSSLRKNLSMNSSERSNDEENKKMITIEQIRKVVQLCCNHFEVPYPASHILAEKLACSKIIKFATVGQIQFLMNKILPNKSFPVFQLKNVLNDLNGIFNTEKANEQEILQIFLKVETDENSDADKSKVAECIANAIKSLII